MSGEGNRGRLVVELLVTLGVLWYSLPEHRRRELLMRMLSSGQRLTERAARWVGREAMLDELAGSEKAAEAGYHAAYRLMTGPRVKLGRAYDKLRGAIT